MLVNKRELSKLWQAVGREGMTLVPLRLYFNEKGRAKLTLGLATSAAFLSFATEGSASDGVIEINQASIVAGGDVSTVRVALATSSGVSLALPALRLREERLARRRLGFTCWPSK